jgi:thiosulfate/3-mercaptopyruvate sulfurtransferase
MTAYHHPDVLVDPAWLAAHLAEPNLRVIELSEDAVGYEGNHIPGAIFWDVYTTLLRPDLHTQDDPAAAAALFGQAGITPQTTVVCYGRQPAPGAWGFWYLRLFGHQAVRVLDGGVARWTAEGYPLTRDVVAPTPAAYPVPTHDPALRADLATMRAALGQPDTILVDVRTPTEYRGDWFVTGPPGEGERGGHIPDAVPLYYRDTVADDGTIRPAADLLALFSGHGITPDRDIFVYCMVGMRAAHTWFVLTQLLGYPQVHPYDASWNEWGRLPDTPITQ